MFSKRCHQRKKKTSHGVGNDIGGTLTNNAIVSRIRTVSKKKTTSLTNGQEIRSDTAPKRISKLSQSI